MATNDPGNDPVERALRLFVYTPIGVAAYLRDSAPTLMEVFVARGRREVKNVKHSVEQKLGLSAPEPAPGPSVQQRVTDGLVRVTAQAGSMRAAMAGLMNAAAPTASTANTAPSDAAGTANPPNGTRTVELPIPGYDLLSASQVIERLDGLSRGALDRIRGYELAHRARRTILASIDQLTS